MNMKALAEYFGAWWTITARPIYFYTKLKEESWKEGALTFLLLSSWILSAVITLVIFIVQYIPIGSTLVEGIGGLKFMIVLPVLITLAAIFFMITLLILAGLLSMIFFAAFYLIALLLHYIYLFTGGRGTLNRMVQSAFYSSAVVMAGILPSLLAIMTRYGALDFSLFRVGYNLIYFLTIIFVYGLWAVAGRKAYGVPKWKAFAGALLPVIILLLFGFAFDKIALLKLESWITPLK